MTFIILAVAFVVLIEMIFLVGYRVATLKDANRMADTLSQQMSGYVEERFRGAQDISLLLRGNEYSARYLQETDYNPDRYARVKLQNFVEKLFSAGPSSKYAVAITKLTDDYAMMHNCTGTVNFMLQQLYISPLEYERMIQVFEATPNLSYYILHSRDNAGNNYYTIVQRVWSVSPLIKGRIPPLYVFVSYSERQFFLQDSIGNSAFLVMQYGQTVASTGNYEEESLKLFLSENRTEKGSIIRYISSQMPGLSFFYTADKPAFFNTVSVLILIIGGIAAAGTILAMFFITKSIYRPIWRVVHSAGEGIPLENEDEFAYLQESFSALRTNMESLSKTVGMYENSYENKFFHDLLTGLTTEEQRREFFSQRGIMPSSGSYAAVIIQYKEKADPGVDVYHDMAYEARLNLGHAMTKTMISSFLYRIIDLNMYTQGIIFRINTIEEIEEQLRVILLEEEPEHGLDIMAYIGGVTKGLENVNNSYRQARILTDRYEFISGKSKVVCYDALIGKFQDTNSLAYFPVSTEQVILNAVVHGKEGVWKSQVQEIFESNSIAGDQSLQQLTLLFSSTIQRLLNGAEENIEAYLPQNVSIYKYLRFCSSPKELQDTVTELLNKIQSRMESRNTLINQDAGERMTDFVHANYTRDISLFDLADHMNMSKNYVSTLFKNVIGQNFKDYLGKYRFERAVELIRENPNKKIKDIAQSVGANFESLSRLFVRYAGINPSEYQQECHLQKDLTNK